MPQADLLSNSVEMLARLERGTKIAKDYRRDDRTSLRYLCDVGYARLSFDWTSFEAVVSITDEGKQRLDAQRQRNLTPL